MHTHIHIHKHIHKHIHIYTNIYIYICIHTHINTHLHLPTCTLEFQIVSHHSLVCLSRSRERRQVRRVVVAHHYVLPIVSHVLKEMVKKCYQWPVL
jgi:hypothetical protein